jgi:hypothetical protein
MCQCLSVACEARGLLIIIVLTVYWRFLRGKHLIITAENIVYDVDYVEWAFFNKIAKIFVCFTKLLSE